MKRDKYTMEIFDIRNKLEYLKEVIILEHNEWAKDPNNDFDRRIENKIDNVVRKIERNDFCKLILLEENNLVGFISIFPQDGDECIGLTPWYSTMYIKKNFRGKGYSKILNDSILLEAKIRGYKQLFLKTDLVGYYEKFGAKYIKQLQNGESLYKFEL